MNLRVDLVPANLDEVGDDVEDVAIGVEGSVRPAFVDGVDNALVRWLEQPPPGGRIDDHGALGPPVVPVPEAVDRDGLVPAEDALHIPVDD